MDGARSRFVSSGRRLSTLQPIAGKPADLSQHLNDGGELKAGDHVVITTIHGTKRKFTVRSVHDDIIYGDHDSVPFSEIASIDRRDFSATKTTILVVVILGVVAAIESAANSAEHPNVGL